MIKVLVVVKKIPSTFLNYWFNFSVHFRSSPWHGIRYTGNYLNSTVLNSQAVFAFTIELLESLDFLANFFQSRITDLISSSILKRPAKSIICFYWDFSLHLQLSYYAPQLVL